MIPLPTTSISVLRVPADDLRDPYEAQPAASLVASGVRAHIGSQGGTEVRRGGAQETVTWRLDADPVDLRHGDQVLDERTGDTFTVDSARLRTGLGWDHVEAGLRQVDARDPA